jgi:ATP-dependent DNA helicase RecG
MIINDFKIMEENWLKLPKSFNIEAEYGYTDIQGKQYRFSEFVCLTFNKSLDILSGPEKRRCREFAQLFAGYSQLDLESRQKLIENAVNFVENIINQEDSQGHKNIPEKNQVNSIPNTKPLPQNSSYLGLDQLLTTVAQIGKYKGEILAKLGLKTVRDLLFYYPRDHIDYARQVKICDLEPGTTVTLIGKVHSRNLFTTTKNKNLTIFELILKDESGKIKINRFFAGARYSSIPWQESFKKRYPVGAILAASGLVKESKYGITLEDPQMEVLASPGDTIDSSTIGRIVPVYTLTEGVAADLLRKAVATVLPTAKKIADPLPKVLQNQYGLVTLSEAIANIHFPENYLAKQSARRRLVFDEFFYLQLGLLQRRQTLKQQQASAILAPTGQLIEEFYKILPFKLTDAQERVINDILNDLQKPAAMNRLIQGDVGSGKTVVAVVAILAAIQAGYQAALMSPTEVLAEQHYNKLVHWFNLLHLPVELLTGSTKIAKRRQIHAQLETGELPLLVGTHALIQDKVIFHKLGLVVIDEQHRFGVQQRALLQQKGVQPHVLTMTATPIPRTLALTLHGDLDVSQIDELPPGRQAIKTTVLAAKDRQKIYELIRREIAQGRQAYIVLPLIEESEKMDLRSAIEEHKRLQESIFPDLQIGLLHGRMSSAEKEETINLFRQNQTQIIVSTTVIEVGVDVPNATVMLIENAERFGLSQLHQLRGRVGRGSDKSYCLLMGGKLTADARQRLDILAQSQDGFFLAEMDMRLRGPGQVLGTKQSGLPDFALASLVEDQEVLELARDAAEKIILQDKKLKQYPLLRNELEYRYNKLMGGSILT